MRMLHLSDHDAPTSPEKKVYIKLFFSTSINSTHFKKGLDKSVSRGKMSDEGGPVHCDKAALGAVEGC